MSNLVRHSPIALKRYMTDINISVDELSRKTQITTDKLIEALDCNEPIFRLSELEEISKYLFVPSLYLKNDNLLYETDLPNVIDHRNLFDNSIQSYKFQSIIRSAYQARLDYLFVLESMDEQPKPFDLKLMGDDAREDAQRIIEYFNLKSTKGRKSQHNDYYSSWRLIIEAQDIMVLEIERENLSSDGFCLYYSTLPIIGLFSAGQGPERRLFTMIHELVHLGLRKSIFDGNLINQSDIEAERYCNAVTGYVIAPESLISKLYDPQLPLDELVNLIRSKAKVSRPAVAIQLKLTGYITQEELNSYLNNLERLKQVERQKRTEPPRIPMSTKIICHYGHYFVQSVMSAMMSNQINVSTAKQILGIKDTYKPDTLRRIGQNVKVMA